MGTEIERKFLVTGDSWKSADSTYYCQGYLNRDRERTVRVRIAGEKGILTIKGISTGASRQEFEYEVPLVDAKEMLELCEKPPIEKYRRVVQHAGMAWEVDEFLGDNEGLIVAEIELESETQSFEMPDWIGEEVTSDPRYFNSRLSINPFCNWDRK
jgi:CYTH domain-containing protein